MTGPLSIDEQYVQDLARLRARNSLLELVGEQRRGDVQAVQWGIDPARLGRESVVLHSRVRSAAAPRRSRETDAGRGASDPFARIALIDARAWESLAADAGHGERFGALVNSAVAYELAGYQANASCLARSAERALGAMPTVSFALAASAFVQRQFLRVVDYARTLNRPPDLTAILSPEPLGLSAFSRSEQPEDGFSDDDIANFAAQAYGARALRSAALYFLSGQSRRFDEALRDLAIADEGFRAVGAIRNANLTANLKTLLPAMVERSTWTQLSNEDDSVQWRRYLQVLARGLDDDLLSSRSISELWPSQLAAIDGGLLETRSSLVLRMPTSAGKTRVAELAIVDTLLNKPGSTCLYIAPFRALADEVEAALDRVLGELGFSATSMVGGPENTGVEELLAAECQVLVLTPEKADLLLRSRPDLIDQVALVVLDEGHIVGDRTRGPRYELLVSRLQRRLPDARFLLLSAVVPDLTLQDFAGWLGAPARNGILSSTWRPAIQRVAVFEWNQSGGTLRYRRSSEGPDEADAFARFLPRLIPTQEFTYTNPVTNRRNSRKFPQPSSRGQLIAALAYKFVKTGPVLMFAAQANWAEACADALVERLILDDRTEQDRPSAFRRSSYPSADVAALWLGESDKVTRMLRHGVGVHHGQLPDAVRRAVEDDFRAGRLRALAATTTLGQGVNLPVRTVLIHSVRRREEDGGNVRITARDYWNIAGRAGRAGFETDGLVVHLALNPTDFEDIRYFLASADSVEPVESSLLTILNDLVGLRISSSQALAELDPSLMALLVEEGSDRVPELVAQIGPLLQSSLVGVQAAARNTQLEPLSRIAEDGAQHIATLVPFDLLESFARTGLTSGSCQWLAGHIREHEEQVRAMLADPATIYDFVDLALDAFRALDEMQPRREYDGDYTKLTFEWMTGRALPDIADRLALPGTEPDVGKVARAVEEIASYLYPWGLSAYLQIASTILDIEPDQYVAALPALVRYGVPDPVAAWLMGFGLTGREDAIAVGRLYRNQSEELTPLRVRDWFAEQDPVETCRNAGIARPGSLREVAKSIARIRRPRLARDLQSGPVLPREALVVPDDDPLAGMVVASLRIGQTVEVSRDYDDLVDRNAVAVAKNGQRIGRLDGFAAAVLAVQMDGGLDITATVISARTPIALRLESGEQQS